MAMLDTHSMAYQPRLQLIGCKMAHRSAQGKQLNYILLEANDALFGPAVDEYLRELKAEKGRWLSHLLGVVWVFSRMMLQKMTL